ncbi:MAG TPA: hypothetical protein VKA46_27400 [Gemmataceae bacterium]|nr:hypothetical protein [Gemmataceae bacterium]
MHRLAIVAAALTVALVLADPASAASNKGPSPFAAQIKELHDVKVLLEMANHDYKGHRAEAVKHIGHAIHALEMGHKHHHGKGAKGKGEPQALSDAQLKESIKVLNGVLAQLSGASGAPATKGAVHVVNAIKELEVALTIK